jgi:Phage integrase, N-terminal SAM-like domain
VAKRGRSEGTIRSRPDGRWEGRLLLGFRNGQRLRPSIYGKTRKEVMQKLDELRKKFNDGIELKDQTVHEFLTRWLEDTAKGRLRPRTFAGYEHHIKENIEPLLGHLKLGELTPQHVQHLVGAEG